MRIAKVMCRMTFSCALFSVVLQKIQCIFIVEFNLFYSISTQIFVLNVIYYYGANKKLIGIQFHLLMRFQVLSSDLSGNDIIYLCEYELLDVDALIKDLAIIQMYRKKFNRMLKLQITHYNMLI